MKKNLYSMTVNNQETNDFLSLTSQYGQPAVCFSVNSNGCANDFVVTSKADLMQIIDFLQQRCDADEQLSSNGPCYDVTGIGLCIMNYSGKVLATYYGKDEHGIEEDVDAWSYESLQQRFPQDGVIYVLFDLYDKAIGRHVLLKIIRSCVALQARFVATGLPMHCRRMIQQDVAEVSGYDLSVVSRATKNVRILTPRMTFTLDNNVDPSFERPSLFDPGSSQFDLSVSRLEVLYAIKTIIDNENRAKPFSDDAIYEQLLGMGYKIVRRTVVKYRNVFLDIPNSNKRRQRD